MKENTFLKRSKILEDNQDYLIDSVKTISQVFIDVIIKGGKLIFAGNGGSAAEAQHMSAEYVGTLVTSNKRNPIPSIALSVDSSLNSKKDLKYLVKSSQTPRGLNEHALKYLRKAGFYRHFSKSLNSILKRLNNV